MYPSFSEIRRTYAQNDRGSPVNCFLGRIAISGFRGENIEGICDTGGRNETTRQYLLVVLRTRISRHRTVGRQALLQPVLVSAVLPNGHTSDGEETPGTKDYAPNDSYRKDKSENSISQNGIACSDEQAIESWIYDCRSLPSSVRRAGRRTGMTRMIVARRTRVPPVRTMMPAPVGRRRSPIIVRRRRTHVIPAEVIPIGTPAVPLTARPTRIAVAARDLEMETVSVNRAGENVAAVVIVEIAPAVHRGVHSAAELIALFLPVVLGPEMDGDFFSLVGLEQRALAFDFLDLARDADALGVASRLRRIALFRLRLRERRERKGRNNEEQGVKFRVVHGTPLTQRTVGPFLLVGQSEPPEV